MMYPRVMQWGRLAQIRTVILILIGSGALIVAGFMLRPWAGWVAVAVVCFFLEYMTGGTDDQSQRR